MPLSMNRDVFITCAVTGAGDTVGASSHVPITPKQIAESALDAAKAGAAVVHCLHSLESEELDHLAFYRWFQLNCAWKRRDKS